MKKYFFRFLLSLVLMFTAANAAFADDDALKKTLEGRYEAMKIAMEAQDEKAILAVLAPDFISVDVALHTLDAVQLVKRVNALSKDPLRVTKTTILSVKSTNNEAVVEQRYLMHTTKTGEAGTVNSQVDLTTESTDTWKNTDGVWLLQKTVTKMMDLKINDKTVVHKVLPQ